MFNRKKEVHMENQWELWLQQWPMIYVMLGLCVIGIVCKMLANIGWQQMTRQVRRLHKGKEIGRHKMTKRLVEDYEEYICRGVKVHDLDNYIETYVTEARVLGVPIATLDNLNLTMMVTCFSLGAVGGLTAFLNGARDKEVVFIFTVGLALTGITVIAEVLFRGDYHRMYYLIGMHNYLYNEVQPSVEAQLRQQDAVEQARSERAQVLRETAPAADASERVNRQLSLLKEITDARRQGGQAVSGDAQLPVSKQRDTVATGQADAVVDTGEFAYRDTTDAGIAAAQEALGTTKPADTAASGAVHENANGAVSETDKKMDHDLLEEILRSLLME
jgi:hypothetical protein